MCLISRITARHARVLYYSRIHAWWCNRSTVGKRSIENKHGSVYERRLSRRSVRLLCDSRVLNAHYCCCLCSQWSFKHRSEILLFTDTLCSRPLAVEHLSDLCTTSVREYVLLLRFSDFKKTWLFTFFLKWRLKKRKKSQKVSSLLTVYRNFGTKTPGSYGYL